MQLGDEIKIVSNDGKFMLEINDHGFALRRLQNSTILLDASTFFTEEEITFSPNDFKVVHKRRFERTDPKKLLYDYYQLLHKPVKK